MALLIIGSKALQNLYGTSHRKFQSDEYDFISEFSDKDALIQDARGENLAEKYFPVGKNHWVLKTTCGKIFEFFECNHNSNQLIYDYVSNNNPVSYMVYFQSSNSRIVIGPRFRFNVMFPDINILYMIKMSHRFKRNQSIQSFEKTLQDIKFMRSKKAEITPDIQHIYELRKKETYDYSHPILNKSKTDFFTDEVKYIYDHDTIHESIKHLDKPAYQYFKPDNNEVMCDKKMFDSLPDHIKLLSVYEEAWVLAIERAIVPFNISDPVKIKERFNFALVKVCTSITSGWFREFAWENYEEVLSMFSMDPYSNFLEGVKNSTVKKFATIS